MIIKSPSRNELDPHEEVMLDEDEFLQASSWNRIMGSSGCTVIGAAYSNIMLSAKANVDVHNANIVVCGDMSQIHTGPNCKVITGNGCTIEVADNCDVLAGNNAMVIATDSCTVEVGQESRITAGRNCTLKFRSYSCVTCHVSVCYTNADGGTFYLDGKEIVKC